MAKHGLGVMNDIEMMINLVKDGKEDLLVHKIHSVSDLGRAVVSGLSQILLYMMQHYTRANYVWLTIRSKIFTLMT